MRRTDRSLSLNMLDFYGIGQEESRKRRDGVGFKGLRGRLARKILSVSSYQI